MAGLIQIHSTVGRSSSLLRFRVGSCVRLHGATGEDSRVATGQCTSTTPYNSSKSRHPTPLPPFCIKNKPRQYIIDSAREQFPNTLAGYEAAAMDCKEKSQKNQKHALLPE